jgi:hypothetical protein
MWRVHVMTPSLQILHLLSLPATIGITFFSILSLVSSAEKWETFRKRVRSCAMVERHHANDCEQSFLSDQVSINSIQCLRQDSVELHLYLPIRLHGLHRHTFTQISAFSPVRHKTGTNTVTETSKAIVSQGDGGKILLKTERLSRRWIR